MDAFGQNQFAYSVERGARDALLYLMLSWLLTLANGKKIGIYCSDVSGAFDKVDAQRLLMKLRLFGLHPQLLEVIKSWLRKRRAHIAVAGSNSVSFDMQNMVYQGTIWGPPFWNCYYADAKLALQKMDFTEIIFADDLNGFKEFANSTSNDDIFDELAAC